ncbi:Nitrite transporter NirC [Corynebacterium felinum]|uniref:formate/nitrite transporter family protein n=1 Tax=Corynebacterium felinum TaxID=131318 RepID=UPI00286BCD1A|nr:formate/nitrite transporter family protein [Corynebacterium felinum]WJY94065.1 Nitrite transporter NirC [Corynebacterium felinum]
MTLNVSIDTAIAKKVDLLTSSPARYVARSVYAGAYLTLGTAFAAQVGSRVEAIAPGLGAPVFALLFFVGLATIIFLGAELTTSNMMYVCFAAYRRHITASRAAALLAVCTVFNLVGALLVGLALSHAYVFAHMDPSHLAANIVAHKLDKSPTGWIIEGIIANFVVNMGVIACLLLKDATAKLFTLMFVIAIFVGLGTEHVIANFSLMSIVGFAADPLPEQFALVSVAQNWVWAWIGNFLGGGVLMGAGYAWLNSGPESYRD